jgi:hypothetical protein
VRGLTAAALNYNGDAASSATPRLWAEEGSVPLAMPNGRLVDTLTALLLADPVVSFEVVVGWG